MKWSWSTVVIATALFGSAVAAQDLPGQARAALAPTGKLRVALLPLPHMALRDQSTGQFTGVIVDLGRELAKRLDVPVEFAAANSNVAAVDQVRNGLADVTFLVGLPALATQIDFGPAYIGYETTFLVPGNSPIQEFRLISIARATASSLLGPAQSLRRSAKHSRTSGSLACRSRWALRNGWSKCSRTARPTRTVISLTCCRSRRPTSPDGELCLEAT